MSAKGIAASAPRRATGWSVTSAAASGFRASSRNPYRSRIARYSGRYRPACRMSHTGVYEVGCRRAARNSGASRSDTQESLSSAPMAYITGKQAFLRILKQEGVSVMFGNPGTTELPLMDGLARSASPARAWTRPRTSVRRSAAGSRAAARTWSTSGSTPRSREPGPGLGQPRGHALREAPHGGQHALVRDARPDVHPDAELRR